VPEKQWMGLTQLPGLVQRVFSGNVSDILLAKPFAQHPKLPILQTRQHFWAHHGLVLGKTLDSLRACFDEWGCSQGSVRFCVTIKMCPRGIGAGYSARSDASEGAALVVLPFFGLRPQIHRCALNDTPLKK
jgi:hypothetical protein